MPDARSYSHAPHGIAKPAQHPEPSEPSIMAPPPSRLQAIQTNRERN
ncbi:MAG: hypothetical protein LC104_13220 [Bacteroidales bacterium]|nr:hypothetical protein [Bacteroidales bacterium]